MTPSDLCSLVFANKARRRSRSVARQLNNHCSGSKLFHKF